MSENKRFELIINIILVFCVIVFSAVVFMQIIDIGYKAKKVPVNVATISTAFKTSMNSSYSITNVYVNKKLTKVMLTTVSTDNTGILYPHFTLKDFTKNICDTNYQASTGEIRIDKAKIPVNITCRSDTDFPVLLMEVPDAWARIYLLVLFNGNAGFTINYLDYKFQVKMDGYQKAVDELMAGFYSK